MRKFRAVILVLVGVMVLAGCTITQFRKKVIVEKDADGKIIKTTITEELIQPSRSEAPEPDKYLDQ